MGDAREQMVSAERFVNGLADYAERHCSRTLYVYAGYIQGSGALLLKVPDSGVRVAVRPWLRRSPVGMQDVIRSNERFRTFRGQEPNVQVQVAAQFRDNARRYVRNSCVRADHPSSEVGFCRDRRLQESSSRVLRRTASTGRRPRLQTSKEPWFRTIPRVAEFRIASCAVLATRPCLSPTRGTARNTSAGF